MDHREFYEKYKDQLVAIGSHAREKQGLGFLYLNIDDLSSGRMNSNYIEIDSLGENSPLYQIKSRMLANPSTDVVLYNVIEKGGQINVIETPWDKEDKKDEFNIVEKEEVKIEGKNKKLNL